MTTALALMFALVGLTSYGIYQSFGPPNKELDDPFDDHDD